MSTQHKRDIEKLKLLALTATPGPWIKLRNQRFYQEIAITTRSRRGRIVPICEMDITYTGQIGKEQKANADYITKANPKTILALIDALEMKEAQIAAICADVEELSAQLKREAV